MHDTQTNIIFIQTTLKHMAARIEMLEGKAQAEIAGELATGTHYQTQLAAARKLEQKLIARLAEVQ